MQSLAPSSVLAAALVTAFSLAAQGPTSFTINTPTGPLAPNLMYGFGDTSNRLLCQGNPEPVTNLRPIGYFDASGNNSFVQFLSGLQASWTQNIIWEHSFTSAPLNAYYVQNDAALTGNLHSFLCRASIFSNGSFAGAVPIAQVSTVDTENWTVDGCTLTNDAFFLRKTSAVSGNVYVCRPNLLLTQPMVTSGADRAIGPIAVFPNTSGTTPLYQLAYMTQPATGPQRIAVLYYTPSTLSGPPLVSGPTYRSVPTGTTLQDLIWVNRDFLVARASTGGTQHANLVRIHRFNANPPNFIENLTLPGPASVNVGSLAISGDRQWLTWKMTQIVQSSSGPVTETSVAAMRVTDGITTAPGGAYVVVHPLENWTFSGKPFIQQEGNVGNPVNPLNPRMVYYGVAPGSGAPSFYANDLTYDVSVVGRTSTATPPIPNPGTTNFSSFVADGHHSQQDVLWILGLSWQRTNTPGLYLDNPLILGAWVITPSTNFNSSSPVITLPSTGTPLNSCLFMQAGWFPAGGGVTVGRVTELPLF